MNSEYILIAGGALMFAGFGIALIRTAAGMKKQAREKATKCTAQATGRVIRNEKSVTTRNSNNGRRRITAYHPVVRFTDNMGKTQERTHKVGTNPPSYEEGEAVMVSYDPKHPGTFILPKDNDGSPMLQKFLILFGAICFLAAASFAAIGFLAV